MTYNKNPIKVNNYDFDTDDVSSYLRTNIHHKINGLMDSIKTNLQFKETQEEEQKEVLSIIGASPEVDGNAISKDRM